LATASGEFDGIYSRRFIKEVGMKKW
jgi:hypothetical protein